MTTRSHQPLIVEVPPEVQEAPHEEATSSHVPRTSLSPQTLIPHSRSALASAAGPESWDQDYGRSGWWEDDWEKAHTPDTQWPEGILLQSG